MKKILRARNIYFKTKYKFRTGGAGSRQELWPQRKPDVKFNQKFYVAFIRFLTLKLVSVAKLVVYKLIQCCQSTHK